MRLIFTTLICMLASIALSAQELPGIDIQNAPAPLFRDPIYDGAADPTIIWNEEEQEWWIFYTQRRANQNLQGVAYCYGTPIGIAASSDKGNMALCGNGKLAPSRPGDQ